MEDTSQSERIPGFCALCRSRCGCINVVRDGKLVRVEPNPAHPTGAALCAKGRAAPELVASADRLLFPVKRTAPKGSADPGWTRIGWDQALDETAAALKKLAAESGPESVAFSITTPSGTAMSDAISWVERLKNTFGSPNDCYGTEVCNWHKDYAHRFTYGTGIGFPDYAHTGCIVFWGHNPSTSWLASAQRAAAAKSRGAKIVVVDPKRVGLAAKADLWLRVRPGSDAALALGVANLLIQNDWFDRAFVCRWTNGPLLVREDDGKFLRSRADTADGQTFVAWDEDTDRPVDCGSSTDSNPAARLALFGTYTVDGVTCRPAFDYYAKACREYPPTRVAALTRLAEHQVEDMARTLHQSGPVSYYAWSGVGQHTNATQTDRAIALVHVLTGDRDERGGNVHFPVPPTNDVAGWDLLPESQRAKTLGLDARPLGPAKDGWITSDDLYEAILTGRPYPVRGLVGFGANLLVSRANVARGADALRALDFYVHMDLFVNPTAEFADIVLPVNTAWEREGLRVGFEVDETAAGFVQLRPPAVASAGESRSDTWIVFELAKRLGLGAHFWDGDVDAGYRHVLEPTGVTLKHLRAHPEGIQHGARPRLGASIERGGDGRANRAATPTGRIEVYSELLLLHGYAPVPHFEEPRHAGITDAPEVSRFPLVLTSAKSPHYCHSQHRQIASLRRIEPDPVAELHPETAAGRGIGDGDWLILDTPTGQVRMRARYRDTLDPGVVIASHGWWQGCAELNLQGYDALADSGANLNRVISNAEIDRISGSVPHRASRCEVRAIDAGAE